jgi:hypothetical protein
VIEAEPQYVLRIHAIGRFPELEVSAEEFSNYRSARNVLSHALAIEEKYEIVITNYLELERFVLTTTASYVVRRHTDYEGFFEVRSGLNVRLVNLLTAVRLYVDQLLQHVRECTDDDETALERVTKAFSSEYDAHSEYRFMEALRNFVQHRGVPVHSTVHDGRWTLPENGLLQFSLEFSSHRDRLAEDPKFKKQVVEEIAEKVDLKAATRRYVECVSNVHSIAREIVRERVRSARQVIEDAHKRYAEVYRERLTGLSVLKRMDGRLLDEIPLLLDWDDIRVKLQARNRKLSNLSRMYVTSVLAGHDQSPSK